MILSRPNTNWSFLFLYIKIDINESNAETKNKLKHKISLKAYTITPSFVSQIGNKKINPAETPADIIRYNVCTRCNIFLELDAKIIVSFIKFT